MSKKIAVLVRERQEEALRMSLGMTLLEDTIDVFILDRPVADSGENAMNMETMKEMGLKIYTNFFSESPGIAYVSTGEMAKRLPLYDLVLPY
jgi:hypothetical protein